MFELLEDLGLPLKTFQIRPIKIRAKQNPFDHHRIPSLLVVSQKGLSPPLLAQNPVNPIAFRGKKLSEILLHKGSS